MSAQEAESHSCPFCKEEVKQDATRCKHCQAIIPPAPTHQGVCPYCKESINPAAIRCMHCKSNLTPGGMVGPFGVQRRRLRRKVVTSYQATAPNRLGLGKYQASRESVCPETIIMSDPTETGLGVWYLVGEDEDSCYYEYGGGIV
jgi:hypothetical protein